MLKKEELNIYFIFLFEMAQSSRQLLFREQPHPLSSYPNWLEQTKVILTRSAYLGFLNDLNTEIGIGTRNPILLRGQIGVDTELMTDAPKNAMHNT